MYMKGGMLAGVVYVCMIGSCVAINSLRISEVFRDGTDERIEIHNNTEESFSGSLTVVGVKSGPLVLSGVVLSAGQYMIVGDKLDMITPDVGCPLIKDKGFSLSDTVGFTITLSGEIGIDQVVISTEMLSQYNNTNTSFGIQGDSTTRGATRTEQGAFVLSGFTASPCSGIDSTSEPSSEEQEVETENPPVNTGADTLTGVVGTGAESESPEVGTGSSETPPDEYEPETPLPASEGWGRGDIIVEEVSPLDSEQFGEYLLIHAKRAVSQDITIEGLGQGTDSKTVSLVMNTGDKLYIVDRDVVLEGNSLIYFLPSITLTDSGETITIRTAHGTVLDRVVYNKPSLGMANTAGGVGESERIFSTHTFPTLFTHMPFSGSCVPFIVSQRMSAEGMVLEMEVPIAPTHYCSSLYSPQWLLNTQEISAQCSASVLVTGGVSEIEFILDQGGQARCQQKILVVLPETQVMCERTENTTLTPSIYVSEIHAVSDDLPEYIEVFFGENFSGTLSVEGIGYGTAKKQVALQVSSGSYRVFSSEEFSIPGGLQIITGISLTDGGEHIVLRRQDGQIIDSAVFTAALQGVSQYSSGVFSDTRLFSVYAPPTPGFSMKLFEFIQGAKGSSTAAQCEIGLQMKNAFFYGNSVNVVARIDDKDIQNSSAHYQCSRKTSTPDVVLTGCNPPGFTFPSAGYYTLEVAITDRGGATCTAKLPINYPSRGDSKPGQSTKPASYYQELYLKRKAKFETTKKSLSQFGLQVTTSGEVYEKTSEISTLLSTGPSAVESGSRIIEIRKIMPNPAGKDEGTEKIVLYNTTTEPLISDGLSLFNGKSRKKLATGMVLVPGEEVLIEATLGLANKPSCVTLEGEEIYDRFCYLQAKDDQWFTESYNLLAHTDTSLLSNLHLSRSDEEICMVYATYPVGCMNLGYTKDTATERKKNAKKYTTSLKKIESMQTKVDKNKTTIADLRAKNKKQKQDHTLAAKTLKNSIKAKNQLVALYKQYGTMLFEQGVQGTGEQRDSIFALENLLDELTMRIEENNTTFGVVTVPLQDIEARQGLLSYTLPLEYTSIPDVRSYLLTETKNYIGHHSE